MSSLLLHLLPASSAANDSQASYAYAVVQANGSVSQQGHASAALLPRCDEVLAVVDVQALSWHRLNLPKMPRGSGNAKLRTVLDGMLEDRLLDEPVQLHFALAPSPTLAADGSASTWVAVCDKTWLIGHIAALEAAGQRVQRLLPQRFPSDTAATPHIHGLPDAPSVTLADASGVRCLPLAAANAMGLLADEAQALSAEPAVAAKAEEMLQRRVDIVQSAQDLAAASAYAQQAGWSLAQFDVSLSNRGRLLAQLGQGLRAFASAPRWAVARWGVLALLAANVLGLNAWAFKEQSALSAKRAQITNLLTQTHPQVKVVVDAPVQMQRELAIMRAATGALTPRDLEAIISVISANVSVKWSLSAIEYTAGELMLKGAGLSAAEAQNASGALAAKGYSLRSEGDKLMVSPLANAVTTGAGK
jgi:general secretion pathway protein L